MRSIVAVVVLGLSAGTAWAGGVAPQPAPAPVLIAPSEPDWTGFYAGGQVDMLFDGLLSDGGAPLADIEGNLFGGFVGYRHDFGTLVLGVEADVMFGTLSAAGVGGNFPIADNDVNTTLLRFGGEVGADLGQVLIYGTAGAAWIEWESGGATLDGDGYFWGGGVDLLVSEQVTLGVEVLHHQFDGFGGTGDLEFGTVGLNVAFRF
ncbi:outer membrane protein [Gymnodinialimonas hymeniacidonis]|uniref:outer membrane protein n=1 Tax=Gymnodinialimonas hymeniacidonis TaxID=3126508 RepID=UPI0034C6521B